MKKIKTNTKIFDVKGKPILNADGDADFTVGEMITNVLSGKTENPHRSYQLAKAFAEKKEVELKAEDIVFLKEEIEKNARSQQWGYNAWIAGQVLDILDGTESAKE